jgi:hypothetical protein
MKAKLSFLVVAIASICTICAARAQWTAYPSFLLKSDEKASFTALADTLTMYVGIEFSIILAAYALPVTWLLSRHADKIAAKIAAQEETNQSGATTSSFKVQQLRERENLVFSTGDSLKLIVALLAPLITGALPSLTSAIG